MDYKSLIESAYERAAKRMGEVRAAMPMGEAGAKLNSVMKEYDEATAVVISRMDSEDPGSIPQAKQLIQDKREAILNSGL